MLGTVDSSRLTEDNLPVPKDMYPEAEAYDLSEVYFRSEARRLAGEFRDRELDDQRRVNTFIATVVNDVLEHHLEGVGRVTTTQHAEKVILQVDGVRNPVDLGSFVYDLRCAEPSHQLGRREYKNDVRDWLEGRIRQLIDRVQEYLAGNGVYPVSQQPAAIV